MILTKIFKSNDEFVKWQEAAMDTGYQRQITQIQPLVMNMNASGEDEEVSDWSSKSSAEISVGSYGLFVVYLED